MTPGTTTAQKRKRFDPKTFLSVIDSGRELAEFAKKQRIFRQGDSSDSVFYLLKGKVQLTVTSKTGKEAVNWPVKRGRFPGRELPYRRSSPAVLRNRTHGLFPDAN